MTVKGLSGVTAISAGGRDGLALLSNGTVMAWGSNTVGELGNGSTVADSDVPVPVRGLTGVKAVSAGGFHGMALLSNGKVKAWGYNHDGELGNGTNTDSNVPVAVTGLTGVKAISAGGDNSLALLPNTKVMAWGDNLEGQLGNGTNTSTNLPVAVKGLSGVKAISAGFEHGLARK